MNKVFAYQSLSGIDNLNTQGYSTAGGSEIGTLINQFVYIIIAAAIALAIFMIIRAGYEYMTSSDNADKKGRSKRRLQAAFGGLLLALGSVLILRTINPELVSFSIDFNDLEGVKNPDYETRDVWEKPTKATDEIKAEGISDAEEVFKTFQRGNLYYDSRFAGITPEEWSAILEKTNNEESHKFVLRLLEEQEFQGQYAEPHLLNALGDIEKVNPELIAESKRLFESRKDVGFYFRTDYGSIVTKRISSPIESDDFTSKINSHSTIFKNEDSEAIVAMYAGSQTSPRNNSFSSTIVDTLNNTLDLGPTSQDDIQHIRNWVDQNGQSIGITKTEDGYKLAD